MNIQLDRIDNWAPDALLARLVKTTGLLVRDARVTCGGEHGVVLSFTTDDNERFTYTMPSVVLAVRAVMRMVAEYPIRFPLKLIFESSDRATFKRA